MLSQISIYIVTTLRSAEVQRIDIRHFPKSIERRHERDLIEMIEPFPG